MEAGREPLTAARFRVRGRVQGVGFRWRTREQGLALGLAGWVRNCPDGSVEVEVEGPAAAVEALADWLESRDSPGHVRALSREPRAPEGLQTFEIRP